MTAIEAAEKVRSKLTEHGFQAYLVGGCVRDLILGREPKDYDVTTDAVPDEVQLLFPKTISVGASFGVVVVVQDEHQIEVATFRADGEYSDARRPDTVTYSREVQKDVIRRDFTINGLLSVGAADAYNVAAYKERLRGMGVLFPYADGWHVATRGSFNSDQARTEHHTINGETYGIIDHVGGLDDLHDKVIRCIGDPEARFTEDALRMLRAVRFAAQLNFEIEPRTLAAIRKLVPTITKISKERIVAELFKLVSAPNPVKGLVPLMTTGLMRYVLPGFSYAGNFGLTLRRFANFPTADPLKGMAMLLADIDREDDELMEIVYGFKLSSHQIDVLEGVMRCGMKIANLDLLTLGELKKLMRIPGISIALDLYEQEVVLDLDTLNPEFEKAISLMRNFTPEDIRPKPLITGDDLIAMSIKPGPIFTTLLGAVEIEQLNGTLTTSEEARKFVLDYMVKEPK